MKTQATIVRRIVIPCCSLDWKDVQFCRRSRSQRVADCFACLNRSLFMKQCLPIRRHESPCAILPRKMWFVLCSHSFRKGCVGFGRRLNSCCPVCDPRIVALAFSASLIRITAWCRRLSKSPSHFVNHALRRSHNIEGDSPIGPSKVAK